MHQIGHELIPPAPFALWLLGEIGSQANHLDDENAEAAYRQAMAVADEIGMRPLKAGCHLGLALLHRRVGRLEDSRAERAKATDLLRSMESLV